jgi:hypothetical protein
MHVPFYVRMISKVRECTDGGQNTTKDVQTSAVPWRFLFLLYVLVNAPAGTFCASSQHRKQEAVKQNRNRKKYSKDFKPPLFARAVPSTPTTFQPGVF